MTGNEKRLISADFLIDTCKEIAKNEWNKRVAPVSWSDAYEGFIDTIEGIPTVDAVEVVRCKDCKWWESGKDYKPYCNHWKSGLYDVADANDFCSYGERKDNEI